MLKAFGKDQTKKLQARLDDLQAALTLEVMRPLPGRCHELKGDRKGQLALSLKEPYRLIFEPANDPIPTKPDGGLDWPSVTEIRILEVVDYHE